MREARAIWTGMRETRNRQLNFEAVIYAVLGRLLPREDLNHLIMTFPRVCQALGLAPYSDPMHLTRIIGAAPYADIIGNHGPPPVAGENANPHVAAAGGIGIAMITPHQCWGIRNPYTTTVFDLSLDSESDDDDDDTEMIIGDEGSAVSSTSNTTTSSYPSQQPSSLPPPPGAGASSSTHALYSGSV